MSRMMVKMMSDGGIELVSCVFSRGGRRSLSFGRRSDSETSRVSRKSEERSESRRGSEAAPS